MFQSLPKIKSETLISVKSELIFKKVGLKAKGISEHHGSYKREAQFGFTEFSQQKSFKNICRIANPQKKPRTFRRNGVSPKI